jgi:DNA topoisomerase-2
MYRKPEEFTFDKVNNRWEVGVAMSDSGTFQQVSFVNAICTSRGGTHCSYVADQIVKKVADVLSKKHKKLNIKPA